MAVRALAQGRHLHAFCSLQKAVHQAHADCSFWMQSRQEDPDKQLQQDQFSTHDSLFGDMKVQPLIPMQLWSDSENHASFAFLYLVSFPPIAVSKCNPHHPMHFKKIKTISSIACFNMALACQMQAQLADQSVKVNALLNRAYKLYQQAATLLESEPELMQPEPHSLSHSSIVQVYLALCSNMIEVCLAFGNLNEASRWIHRLQHLIETILVAVVPDNVENKQCKKYPRWLWIFVQIQSMYAGSFMAAKAA